jgi:prevent-host-death family protein
MAIKVEAQEAQQNLARYLEQAARKGERIIVESNGQPIAALVSVDDLRRLQELDLAEDDEEGEARFRRAAEAAGLVIRYPSGPPVLPSERKLIHVSGPPLSEQIIADRR